MNSDHPYWDWVRSEAKSIGADGCSGVTEFRQVCCFEHDLGYFYGRDPRQAYRLMRCGHESPWSASDKISKAATDARFWHCNQSRAVVGPLSPVAAYRWLGVTLLAWFAWRRHRKLRP